MAESTTTLVCLMEVIFKGQVS